MWHRSFALRTATISLTAASSILAAAAAPNLTQIPIDSPGFHTASFAWADYDQDGDLDVLAGGSTAARHEIQLLRNDGGLLVPGSFAAWSGFTGANAWMDFDGDGDLDFASGGFASAPEDFTYPPLNARLFRNDGQAGFSPVAPEIEMAGLPTWGDFDRDGDADLLLAGAAYGDSTSSEYDPRRIRIYRNQRGKPWLLAWDLALPFNCKPPLVEDWDHDGWLDIIYVYNRMDDTKALSVWHGAPNFEFAPTESDYSGYIWPYILDWNDYDNDGDLDSAFTGEVSLTRTFTMVLNQETGSRVQPLAGEGVFAVTSADLDNDGRLDLLSTEGSEGDLGSLFRLHTNLGSAPWFEVTDLPFRGAGFSTISCADYDQDGDADVLVSGFTNWTPSLRLLRNDSTVSNPPPSAPTELQSVLGPGGSVHLRWTGSTDANQETGLTYNVRAGLSPQSAEILAPNADLETGRLLVPRRGNAGSRTLLFLTNLLAGSYHWSVQAVDNAFAASPFAPSASFMIPPSAPRDLECVATDLRYQHATLIGSAIPNGAETLLWFEYGLEESLGTTTEPVAVGLGVSAISVTNEITGLQTALTYYFRCTASNAVGVTHSPTQSLSILNTAPTINLVQNRIVSTAVNVAALPIDFSIADLETLPENLLVSAIVAPAYNSNTNLVTPEGIALTGANADYSLILTPALDERGMVGIALSVADEHGGVTSVYLTLKVEDFTRALAVPQGLGTSLAWVDVDHDTWPDLLGNLRWIQNLAGTNLAARSLTQGTTVTGYMQPFDAEADGWIDFAITGTHTGNFLTQVFTNRQAIDNLPTAFRALPTTLQPGFQTGMLSAVDYDQDGDTDLVAFGSTNRTPVSAFGTQAWRNDRELVFTPVDGLLPRLTLGDMVWADFDGDGDNDVVVTGSTNRQVNGSYTALLLNNGSGEFSPASLILPQLSSGFVTAGDIDNDNDLDLVLAGIHLPNNQPTGMGVVLRQNPDRSFEEVLRLPNLMEPRGILVDADNDGDLDLFYVGQRDLFSTLQLHFCLNPGGGDFVQVAEPEILSLWPLAFADYDHDSDLDLATPTLLYRNLTQNLNTPPSAPTELASEISGAHVTLMWLRAGDANQGGGLTYNLRVGSTPGGMDIMSPMADPVTGMRHVTGPGNASQSTVWKLRNLPPGTYYWSVQAIDHSFAGGPFAAEASFTIAPGNPLAFAGIQAGPDGVISLQFERTAPIECVLEFSNDLRHWSPLETLVLPSGTSVHPLPPSSDRNRFYRLVVP